MLLSKVWPCLLVCLLLHRMHLEKVYLPYWKLCLLEWSHLWSLNLILKESQMDSFDLVTMMPERLWGITQLTLEVIWNETWSKRMWCIFYLWLWSCLQLLFRVFRAMPNTWFCFVSCEVDVGCRQVISKWMKAMSATADEGIDAAYLFYENNDREWERRSTCRATNGAMSNPCQKSFVTFWWKNLHETRFSCSNQMLPSTCRATHGAELNQYQIFSSFFGSNISMKQAFLWRNFLPHFQFKFLGEEVFLFELDLSRMALQVFGRLKYWKRDVVCYWLRLQHNKHQGWKESSPRPAWHHARITNTDRFTCLINSHLTGSMLSPSKDDISLCGLRKEETIRSKCLKYSVPYVPPDALQTDRELMQSTFAKQKEKQKKKHQRHSLSPETRTLTKQKTRNGKKARLPQLMKRGNPQKAPSCQPYTNVPPYNLCFLKHTRSAVGHFLAVFFFHILQNLFSILSFQIFINTCLGVQLWLN